MKLVLLPLMAVALTVSNVAVEGADLVGRTSIIDGDTLEIHGIRIRFVPSPSAPQPLRGPPRGEKVNVVSATRAFNVYFPGICPSLPLWKVW